MGCEWYSVILSMGPKVKSYVYVYGNHKTRVYHLANRVNYHTNSTNVTTTVRIS